MSFLGDSDIQAEQDEKNEYKLKGKLDEKYGWLTRRINPLKEDIYIPPVELYNPRKDI